MIAHEPDIIGMRERLVIDGVRGEWYDINESNIEFYRMIAPGIFKERNEIVHKDKEYRFIELEIS